MADDTRIRPAPLLPLRDIVVFPFQVVPLFVGREKSLGALEEAMSSGEYQEIFLSAQRQAGTEEPNPSDIHDVGTLAGIIQVVRLADGTVKVLVEGRRRAVVRRFVKTDGCYVVDVEPLPEPEEDAAELAAMVRQVQASFETFVKLNKRVTPEILASVQTIEEAGALADTVIGHLPLKLADKQKLLEVISPWARLTQLLELLKAEVEVLEVERRIRTKVKRRAERVEKEQYLSDQIQSLGKEADGRDEFKSEIAELEERARHKALSAEAKTKVEKEIKKLRMMAPMSAEAAVVRNYIDWILALPWGDCSQSHIDVAQAQVVLDEEHFGLTKVKERILEYLAVQSLVAKQKGPILCLVGPPGVGKTSLARSIARATGRDFVRLALGGVRDEAEIRGHRRTYIGALPGKIIQSLKKSGSDNPVFLLDEVDKMSADFRGDPSSALLEVLDPEQNKAFMDHFLELDYDLSNVMFIATANYLQGIPAPLLDRMELIFVPGYTEFEKISIAERHLLPKQQRDNGLAGLKIQVPEETTRAIISGYTKESGVRSLERELATICRKIAREYVADRSLNTWKISPKRLGHFLGPSKFRSGKTETADSVGLCNGLAVTSYGGDLLSTEVSIVPGRGKLVLTGKLGDVMQESAQAALSYIRSRAPSLGLDVDFHNRADIHIHLPEGAIPKDGPSAGITMATAVVSALLRVPVRRDVAMTGEITLRGRVLPIGGVKEKLLAAHRAGVTTVIIPRDNVRELREVPKRVLKALKIVAVENVDEVLRTALVLAEPETFLQTPSEAVDWRTVIDRRNRNDERRQESAVVATASPQSALPPGSACPACPPEAVEPA
ncbi:MAG: endopeptidase La [Deltaproteobacteria bacterium]|nr:endopeptidase La [Deltaproteobacteria bacterium]